MKLQILLCIVGLVFIKRETESSIAKKIVLQNEMSEHCRRRVVSSIFLGRQVAESNSEVMHFSRLEEPYSCSIIVRTESGSNIILVMLSKSKKSITKSCQEGYEQLLVYEMGETFGGYWGAMPEYVFRQESRNHSTYYTLKTSHSTESLVDTLDIGTVDYNTPNNMKDNISQYSQHETDENYVMMEVPLVNVSGNLELGETELAHSDEDELFDLIYNVTPKDEVFYETSVMPLVEFSIWKQRDQTQNLSEMEPRYQLDYNLQRFTPDYRLTYRTNNHRRTFSSRRYYSKRRRKLKKKNKLLFSVNNPTKPSWHQSLRVSNITEILTTPKLKNKLIRDSARFDNYTTDTWQLIATYLKMLHVNNLTTARTNKDDKATALLKKISNMKYTTSVYLQSKLTKYSDIYHASITEVNKVKTQEVTYINLTGPVLHSLLSKPRARLNETVLSKLTMGTAKVKLNINRESALSTNKNYSMRELSTVTILPSVMNHYDISSIQSTPVLIPQLENLKNVLTKQRRISNSGSLVDHESWENIVQVAPEMADLLNVTSPLVDVNTILIKKNTTTQPSPLSIKQAEMINRKKRYIKALSIDQHRPRQLSTKEDIPIPDRSSKELDSQRLAELVELQDDEIQGRVALHYYKNYAGSTIFNMCDLYDAKERQVFLFNSSRIVIAIKNFTMDRITIVLTESRFAQTMGCPPAHLECQVSGVRVCVHHMSACDGVPNCGAYDIYDEDRLLCGSNVGLHYSVCLAACIFLVVLLTLLYSVHYWLKRCIPKVSQAFFVYTDKSENILYLDTIMRSPNDFNGSSRLVYHSNFFDDTDLSADSMKNDSGNFFDIIRICLRFIFCKNTKSGDDKIQQNRISCSISSQSKTIFSFAEAELRKIGQTITVNASVQTGDSLELARLNKNENYSSSDVPVKQSPVHGKKKTIYLQQSERELIALRRIRAISSTLQSCSPFDSDKKIDRNTKNYPTEEIELQSTLYDREAKEPVLDKLVFEKTKYDFSSEPLVQKRNATKHLRFEEAATTIEPSAVDKNDDDNYNDEPYRHFTTNRSANIDLDAIEDDEEVASSSGREFRRFWGGGKGKKNKKKTHLSLR